MTFRQAHFQGTVLRFFIASLVIGAVAAGEAAGPADADPGAARVESPSPDPEPSPPAGRPRLVASVSEIRFQRQTLDAQRAREIAVVVRIQPVVRITGADRGRLVAIGEPTLDATAADGKQYAVGLGFPKKEWRAISRFDTATRNFGSNIPALSEAVIIGSLPAKALQVGGELRQLGGALKIRVGEPREEMITIADFRAAGPDKPPDRPALAAAGVTIRLSGDEARNLVFRVRVDDPAHLIAPELRDGAGRPAPCRRYMTAVGPNEFEYRFQCNAAVQAAWRIRQPYVNSVVEHTLDVPRRDWLF